MSYQPTPTGVLFGSEPKALPAHPEIDGTAAAHVVRENPHVRALFSAILHDWDDEQRAALLRQAFGALRPGGTVLVTNHMIDPDRRGKASSLLVSLNMMLITPGGGGYTTEQCRSWLAAAGFVDTGAQPLGEFESLVTGRKPDDR